MTREEREEAKEVIKAYHDKLTNSASNQLDGDIKVFELAIKALQAEPTDWIPVSERLPEPFTFVNATCRSLVDDREDWVIETLYLPIPKEANKKGYSDWGNIPMLNLGEAEVIAWVERIIPKPYKAESEEK